MLTSWASLAESGTICTGRQRVFHRYYIKLDFSSELNLFNNLFCSSNRYCAFINNNFIIFYNLSKVICNTKNIA